MLTSTDHKNHRSCLVCKKTAKFICSPCSSAFYCSKKHQRLHWSAHRLICTKKVISIDELMASNKPGWLTSNNLKRGAGVQPYPRQPRKKHRKELKEGIQHILRRLDEDGFLVVDNFLEGDLAQSIVTEVLDASLRKVLEFTTAQMREGVTMQRVRGDMSSWYDGQDNSLPATNTLIGRIDHLVKALKHQSQEQLMINSKSHAMISCFAGEGERHLRYRENCGLRKWTVRYFPCTLDTAARGGTASGQLRLQLNDNTPVDIPPTPNRLVICLSEAVTQEIRPVYHRLVAITVWYLNSARSNNQEEMRVEPMPSPTAAAVAAAIHAE